LPGKSHLVGLQRWWANWYGSRDWISNPRRMCWIVGVERTFAEDAS
jgi:hypothetical protein